MRPLFLLCELFGGFFVPNPRNGEKQHKDLMTEENRVMYEFAVLMKLILKASKDRQVTVPEAREIRAEWERLKSKTEDFVRHCKVGDFAALRALFKS